MRLPSGPTAVPEPDAFAAYAQDGVVTIMDGWYLARSTPANDPRVGQRMTEDVFLQI